MPSELPSIPAVAFIFSPATAGGQPGRWNEHVPLLRWLIGSAKPRLIVDTATPADSFLETYRESIAFWDLDSRCVAVRSGSGKQVPLSGSAAPGSRPEVLVHDRRAAAAEFRAGSIDLLNLSPLPAPERLVDLYESWLPKLSTRAVVVVGGIKGRRGARGAPELWHRLRAAHAQVSSERGGGLGIAAVGSNSSGAIRQLTSLRYLQLRRVLDILGGDRSGAAAPDEAADEARRRQDEAASAQAEQIANLEHARRLEAERAQRAEFELRHIRQTSTWRMVHALRHPKTLVGWRKAPQPAPAQASLPARIDRKAALRRRLDEEFRQFMPGAERISLAASEAPQISVVIPVWNQAALTLACLRSLLLPKGLALEVVIVDNASSDESGKLFARLDGITVIFNRQNVGFLQAVNQGVAASRGAHVLLLNNDATLRPGSLEAAFDTLQSAADIGAVGGPIILPDGTLQEAGSIIWADGSCSGYGRGRPPSEPEFQFSRDVDYCSGAFLLIARKWWDELGGFDPVYSPAYYEEADFCMRLRQKGLRVVYEPKAAIDHLEFGSTDTTTWTELQIRNAKIFRQRHAATLDRAHHKHGTPLLKARTRSAARQRVLVLEDAVPHRSLGAGLPRSLMIVETLIASGREVTFLPLISFEDDWARVYETLPATVEVMLGIGPGGLAAFLNERRGHYDVVLVSRPHNMSVLDEARRSAPGCLDGALLVYDAEALFSARELMKSRLEGERFSQEAVRARIEAEADQARDADRILAVSEQEAAQFRKLNAGRVLVLPHAVAAQPTPRAWHDRSGLLFVGRLSDGQSPNADSLRWFCREVLPRIGAEELYVAGRAAASLAAACPDARLLGEVADLWDLYDRCRVFVAPTRFAAGIPHKVHEAAAHGIPVVATSLLARQLRWQHERDLLVADDPNEFATCIERLGQDQLLWERLRASALQRVREDCSKQQFRATLEEALTVDAQADVEPAGHQVAQ